MSSFDQSILRRLADNDPSLHHVYNVRSTNCSQYAEALRGNSYIKELTFRLGMEEDRSESLEDEVLVARWTAFGKVVQQIESLEKVVICFFTMSDIVCRFMSVLLQHTRQIKKLYIFHRPTETSDRRRAILSRFLWQLGSGMAGHPTLETIVLDRFRFMNEHSVALQGALTSHGPVLREVVLNNCHMTNGCLGTFVRVVAANPHLQSLGLNGIRIIDYDRETVSQQLVHLFHSTSLNQFSLRLGGLDEGEEWPRFDFLRGNTTLKHLKIIDEYAQLGRESYASLWNALRTNRSLETVAVILWKGDGEEGDGEDGDADALVAMIRNNTVLKSIRMMNVFSGPQLLELVPALAQNSTLEHLDVSPGFEDYSADMASFVKGVLEEARLKTLKVDRCSFQGLESLVPVMAQNYCLEKIYFWPESSAEKALLATMNTIGKLNKFGRRYLVERGLECKVAGVELLSKVSGDLDCLFYHLRENPSLCDRRGATAGES